MHLRSLPNLLLICLVLLVSSCSQKPVYKEYNTVARIGDQPEWAAKDLKMMKTGVKASQN